MITFKIIAIILAKKNSIRLPNKHLLRLGKKKIIEYTFRSVQQSKYLNFAVCFTDSLKIKKLTKKYSKISCPIVRPKHLSLENTSTEETMEYLIKQLRRKKILFENIILLQPTSPFRTTKDIDNSIKKYYKNNSKSLISVKKFKKHLYKLDKDEAIAQNETSFVRDGAIFIFKTKNFLKTKKITLKKNNIVKLKKKNSLDIDSQKDFNLAKKIIKNDKKK